MEEKNLSGEESLQLIRQMIQVAKDEHQEKGDGWLIWGWLLFSASLASVILSYTDGRKYVGYVWLGMIAVGIVVYIVTHAGKKQQEKVQTYVQELLQKIGTGFFISLVVIIIANFQSKTLFVFGYFYVLYGFWMFIHGSALRFRPLIIGAFVNWAAALAIFAIDSFRYDMMVSTVAILVGYLIPGYLLRADYRKKSQSSDRIVA